MAEVQGGEGKVWKYRDGFSLNGKWGQKCYVLPKQRMMITFLSHLEEGFDKIRESMEKHLLGVNEGNDPVAKNR